MTAAAVSPVKWCPKCSATKPVGVFHRSSDRGDGRAGWCRPCVSSYMASGVKRRSVLKATYGLSQGQYDAMVAAQGGVCASCGSPPKGTIARELLLHVDHDHATGKVRGLLCNRCNRALGMLGDDAAIVRGLLAYIEARQ